MITLLSFRVGSLTVSNPRCSQEFNLKQMLDCFYLYVQEKSGKAGEGK